MEESSGKTVSLYFGLKEKRKADLEVVSLAAIEWVNSVRLSVQMIEPTVSIRVEYIDASEGSLSINTILNWGEAQLEKFEDIKYPRLLALAAALSIFLIKDAGPMVEYWFGEPDKLELSDEDREIFDSFMERMSQSESLESSNRKFFNTLARDGAVEIIGISEDPESKPIFEVESSHFAERGGLWVQDEELQERNSERTSDVILVTADLSDSDRKWRFLDIATNKTFTAKMRDEKFMQTLEDGGIEENLRMGIKMQIQISFIEILEGNEWKSVPSTIEVKNVTILE